MSDEIRVQHIFRDPETGFCDAIVLPKEQYEALDAEAIEVMKAERVAAHKALMAEVAARPAPSEAEIVEAKALELAELEARVEVLRAEVPVEVLESVKLEAEPVDVKRVG